MKLIDLLKTSSRKHPEITAIKNEELELSYKQMLSNVSQLSDYLQSIGCRNGVTVAIALGKCPEYFISFFAVSATGGTILPLSSRMTTFETLNFTKSADASIVITNRLYCNRLVKDSESLNNLTVITIGYHRNKELKIEPARTADCMINNETDDVALMVYTSGTTSPAKIVMLTDSQLLSNIFSYTSLMGFDSHNVVAFSLLLNHIYCICAQILTHIFLGDTFIIKDGPFFIKDFFKAVQEHKVTISAFVPYMAMLFAEFPEPQIYNLESLKYITLSGAKTPKTTYLALRRRFPWIQFINTYGMSEAGSRIAIAAPFPDCFPVESVGKPMPGVQVRVVDEQQNIVPAQEAGELEIKSTGVMKGYYKQPALTSRTIVDGWLKTSDLAALDDKSNLFISGRKKDIIISGGNNIYPVEIEQRFLEHPFVLEAVVVAKQDKKLQQVPLAFIVKKAGKKITPGELTVFCKEHLSSYKIPFSIIFLEKIPKLRNSKVDRCKLKRMADNLR